jgi:hypothetical protein
MERKQIDNIGSFLVFDCRPGPRYSVSAFFLGLVLGDPSFHDLPNEGCGQRLIRCESDRPFGARIIPQLVRKLLQQFAAGGKETAMVGEGSVRHKHSVVLERRNAVADRFCRFLRSRRANRRADLLQSGAGWLGNLGQIFIHISGAGVLLRERCLARSCSLFHRVHPERRGT